GRFVSGARPIRLVDAGRAKELDLRVVVPLEDTTVPEEGSYNSIWPSIHPEILKLVESHRSTIVFVNNRRLAERLALRLNELAEKEIARAHLLESAVVAGLMREGAIEETVIPRNPLDVLAQQIVAICAEDEIAVDELHELVRGAYPFADLSRTQLENVLDMLAGRYPSDEFAELRPRIVWDRTAGVIRGRTGARRLAVTNAGTIPDRGLYGVHLVDGGGRVGELDEEMVYEARAGQTFLLGASTWRIEEITRDRVLVSPAPGVPGAVPFWKGEGVGRPYELGQEIGRFSRDLLATPRAAALEKL